MPSTLFNLSFITLLGASLLFLSGCSQPKPDPGSLKEFYEYSLRTSESNPYQTDVLNDFRTIIETYPGTKFASLSSLRLAELSFNGLSSTFNEDKQLKNIELFYRSFLIQNPNHILIPYVLSRLMQVAYIKSINGLFVVGTDPQPYEDSLQIFNNFQLLFPNSIYFDEVQYFAKFSSHKLAKHEESIGDWYFEQQNYAVAISRYLYVLKNFPDYSDKKELSKKLINSFKKNLQFDLVTQYQKFYEELYDSPGS
ncbi:MAG: outer membrane protein assembly factor BamD [SAR324 cluster bacterium]|nr:outer membrane protein assembly factor BamD [SAR324 cluster bacterium]